MIVMSKRSVQFQARIAAAWAASRALSAPMGSAQPPPDVVPLREAGIRRDRNPSDRAAQKKVPVDRARATRSPRTRARITSQRIKTSPNNIRALSTGRGTK